MKRYTSYLPQNRPGKCQINCYIGEKKYRRVCFMCLEKDSRDDLNAKRTVD
jgi:hypothetical protein